MFKIVNEIEKNIIIIRENNISSLLFKSIVFTQGYICMPESDVSGQWKQLLNVQDQFVALLDVISYFL